MPEVSLTWSQTKLQPQVSVLQKLLSPAPGGVVRSVLKKIMSVTPSPPSELSVTLEIVNSASAVVCDVPVPLPEPAPLVLSEENVESVLCPVSSVFTQEASAR